MRKLMFPRSGKHLWCVIQLKTTQYLVYECSYRSCIVFQTVAKQFHEGWLEKNDQASAESLAKVLKLIKRFLDSSEIILRNPENLLNFISRLAVDQNISKFTDTHSLVIDIISLLLVNKNYSSKITYHEDIIVKVRAFS